MRTTRRGFTLVEILVAITIFGVVSGVLIQLLVSTQRVSRAQAERGEVQANARAGTLVLPAELRELGYSTEPNGTVVTDITSMGANFIEFRSMRGLGFLCGSVGTTTLLVRSGPGTDARLWRGLRAPQAGDQLLLFLEGTDPGLASDDRWATLAVSGVSSAGACVGAPTGTALSLTTNLTGLTTLGIIDGAPVRWFETVRYELYASGGQSWLGYRVTSGGATTLQPVLGPLDAADGVRFRYFAADGSEITNYAQRAQVRSIGVEVLGASDAPVRANLGFGALQTDTLRFVTRVALRNNLRP